MTSTTDVYALLWNGARWPLAVIGLLAAAYLAHLLVRTWRDRPADEAVAPIHHATSHRRAPAEWPTRQTPLDHDRVNGMPFKIVPALTMADRYPLPDVAAHYAAPAPVLATVTVRNVTALPGYGSHDRAVAIGCDSQRGPEENTGALDPRAMRDLLAASRG